MGYLEKSLRTNLDFASNIAAACWSEKHTTVSATCLHFLHTLQGASHSEQPEIMMGQRILTHNHFKARAGGLFKECNHTKRCLETTATGVELFRT